MSNYLILKVALVLCCIGISCSSDSHYFSTSKKSINHDIVLNMISSKYELTKDKIIIPHQFHPPTLDSANWLNSWCIIKYNNDHCEKIEYKQRIIIGEDDVLYGGIVELKRIELIKW